MAAKQANPPKLSPLPGAAVVDELIERHLAEYDRARALKAATGLEDATISIRTEAELEAIVMRVNGADFEIVLSPAAAIDLTLRLVAAISRVQCETPS